MTNYVEALGKAENLLNDVAKALLEDRHYDEAGLAIEAVQAIDRLHDAILTQGIEERSLMRKDLDRFDVDSVVPDRIRRQAG